MDNKSVSNWVRQARFRAKKHDIYSDIDMEDVTKMLAEHKVCCYCKKCESETLDHPFPLKDNAPNVLANIVTSCMGCKGKKKNNDLLWMYNKGLITEDVYLSLLADLFARKHGGLIKDHVKKVSGIDPV